MITAMAWRNLLRQRRRSLLTAIAMGVGVALCMMLLAFTEGMYGQIRDVLIDGNLGHAQVAHPEWSTRRGLYDTLADAEALQRRIHEQVGVQGSTARLFGNALVGGKDTTRGAQLVGVQPGWEAKIRELDTKVVAGAWLGDTPGRQVVLGADLADELEVEVGGAVVAVTQASDGSLGNELYDVVGTIRTGSPAIDRAGAFVHLADLQTLLVLDGQIHELSVLGPDDGQASVDALVASIAPLLPAEAVVRPWWVVDPSTAELLSMQTITTTIGMAIFYGLAALGVVNTLLMSVFERTREIGVMRALGLRPRQVVLLIVIESLLLAAVAVVGGGIIGGIGQAYLQIVGVDLSAGGKALQTGTVAFDPIIHARVTFGSVVKPVVGVFFFAVLAAVLPALRAARLDPIAAIRSE